MRVRSTLLSGRRNTFPLYPFDVTPKCSYNSRVKFAWDENKRLANLDKHGLDFLDVPSMFEGDTLTTEDDCFDYGERRFVTLGVMQGRVALVVHTERDDAIRVISVRKATSYEERKYFEEVAD